MGLTQSKECKDNTYFMFYLSSNTDFWQVGTVLKQFVLTQLVNKAIAIVSGSSPVCLACVNVFLRLWGHISPSCYSQAQIDLFWESKPVKKKNKKQPAAFERKKMSHLTMQRADTVVQNVYKDVPQGGRDYWDCTVDVFLTIVLYIGTVTGLASVSVCMGCVCVCVC